MRIGIVIIHCLSTKSSKYVGKVVPYFLKKGHEAHIFTSQYDLLPKEAIIHKIHVPFKSFYRRESYFFLVSTLIKKLCKTDISMAQATRFFSPNVAYMQFVYKAWIEYLKNSGKQPSQIEKIVEAVENYNLKIAKAVIAMSKTIKSQLIKYHGIPSEKIKVIYSGVDLNEFNPNNKKIYRNEIRRKHLLSDEKVLLFVGNPYYRKGLNFLVKALPKIHAKLFVVGKDLGKDRIENYKKEAEKMSCEEKLIYCGFTSEVYKYFAAADIFVLPTLYEPFGLVVLEAMASGLPVIVSKVAGAAELIEDGKDGLLLENPKDPEEIAKKINYLLEDDSLRKRIGRNARKKAEKYPWSRTAEEMLKVFEEVARR
jgi:UDP-glucose:(heptosyl)LPS alpha-1,3-glucosyltransferase